MNFTGWVVTVVFAVIIILAAVVGYAVHRGDGVDPFPGFGEDEDGRPE